MPRTTRATTAARIDLRIDARRATTVGLTSFATLTLLPLLVPAKPTERALLLLAAVPAAALLGYLAGYAASSATHLQAAALQAAQLQSLQVQDFQLRAAQLQAAPPGAPVIKLVSEPVPRPGTGSPVVSGHLAGLARPPAGQQDGPQQGLHLVPTPSREAPTTGATAEAAPGGLGDNSPHLTLIVTHPTQHPTP